MSNRLIIPGSKYGDPKEQANHDPTPHGLTPQTIEQLQERFESFVPGLAQKQGSASRQFFDGMLPTGAELDPRTHKQANMPTGVTFPGMGNMYGGNTLVTPQRPYQPEFECELKGTPVVMADGSHKPIEHVLVGDRVIDKTGRIQTVERAWCSGTPDQVVEIKLWGNKTFYSTLNHNWPVWVWSRKCLCGCGQDVTQGRCYVINHGPGSNQYCESNLVLVDGKGTHYHNRRCIPKDYQPVQKLTADELRAGDYLLIPRKFDVVEPKIPLDQARLLGYYVSEGCPNNNQIMWSLGRYEENTLAQDILNICAKYNIEASKCLPKTRNACKVTTRGSNGKDLCKLLCLHGHENSHHKRLSEEVMRWPVKYKIELIRGMFKGDGSQYSTKTSKDGYDSWKFCVAYGTSSKTLASQTQLVLAQLGIYSSIITIKAKVRKSKETVINQCEHYRLATYGSHAKRLSKLVWEDDNKSIEHESKENKERFRVDDNYIYVPIKSVKVISNKEPVYNLTVSGDHSYLVDNVGTYNSPDRQQFPVHRILANRYWRLFHKLDPVIGNCIDMYATMPWSDFQLTGEGVTGSIKESYELMCEETQILKILEYMVKEFMVIGECCPHNFFDETKGIWTYTALHNPDQLEVIDAPFIKMDPVVEFIPDDRLRAVLTSNNHLLRRVREQMPQELISRLIARQNIPLSPVNMTFIPRRLHPYDTRGTSIITRMWRILMYEDSQKPGTPITRPDGSNTPIEQLVLGDLILGKDGDIQEITHISEKHANKLVYIKLLGGWEMNCTASHKWPVFSKDNPHGKSIKTLASDIRAGDYLSIPRKFKLSELDNLSNNVMARLLGYYVAEGSKATFNKDGYGVAWALNVDEENTWAKDIERLCLEVGCNTKTYIHKSGCMVRSHKNENRWLADWLFINGGQHTATKQLSQMIMGWPLELKEEFIRGYFRGDGSCAALTGSFMFPNGVLKHNVRAATISEVLAHQLQLILAQLGIFAKIRPYQPPNNDGKNRKQIYYLESSGEHADKLGNLVWGQVSIPPRTIGDRRRNSKVIVTETHILIPIIRILIEEYDGLVYSLETSGDHSYLNANVATYNSIYNASIATARRHAGPIKVAKLGNPQTGWIPSPEHEQRLLQLLSQAELDVNAWLVYHYGIQFEMVGTTDRIMNISQHHEVIERIKLIAMGISKCFVYDTLINMADGSYKTIQNVKIGDKILDKNGKIESVTDAWEDGIPEQLVEITTKGGKTFIVTPNHKFPVWAWPRTCACGCGKPLNKIGRLYAHNYSPDIEVESKRVNELTTGQKPKRIPTDYDPFIELEASQINPGDCLLIPRKFESVDPKIPLLQARLLGYYVAEGHIIKGKHFGGKAHGDGFEFSLNKKELTTWAEDIKTICNELGHEMHIRPSTLESGIKVSTQAEVSIPLATWLSKHGGEYASTKRLSEEVMYWPINYKLELIRGMFRGDGTQYWSDTAEKVNGEFSRSLYVKYATTSDVLARQVQLILAQLGFYATLEHKEASGFGELPQTNPTTRGRHARQLSELIWGKASMANDYKIDSNIDTFRVDDEYVYIPIKSIKLIPNTKPVFNLSVTGSHSYLADNVASLNSFLHGEVTYASAATGLSVFLQRMKSLRNFFITTWLLPKFFKPIAKINGWIKRDQGELVHRYRIKRSQKELEMENRYIVPKLEWEKQLDSAVNSELVTAMGALEGLGIKFSKTSKYAAVNKKYEDEVLKIKEEQEFERKMVNFIPPEMQAGSTPAAPPGGGGMLPPPPPPGGMPGEVPPGEMPEAGMGEAPPAGGAMPPAATADKAGAGGGTGPSGKKDPAVRDTESSLWDQKGRYGNWAASEITELADLIKEGHTDSPLWGDLDSVEFRKAINAGDSFDVVDLIREHLEEHGYPQSDIKDLRKILDQEGILKDIVSGDVAKLREVETKMDDSSTLLNDEEAMTRLSSYLDNDNAEIIKTRDDLGLVLGHGNTQDGPWSGDISDMLEKK